MGNLRDGWQIRRSRTPVRATFASRFATAAIGALALLVGAVSPARATDWTNPPVACIEDQAPRGVPCLDLSGVANAQTDLPAELDAEAIRYWTVEYKADLAVCRAREIQRRETAAPGSQTASALQWAWMWAKQSDRIDAKIEAIYAAAERAEMPPQILFGALKQESLLSDLGISDDGGNFSCGIGQINLIEWCHFMLTLPEAEQRRLGWPVGVSCSAGTLPTTLVAPFHAIALGRLGGRPEYELTPAHFSNIAFRDVVGKFPTGDAGLQNRRFAAVTAFVANCADLSLGIAAKGRELRRLYDVSVPEGMKTAQRYAAGKTFSRKCRRPYRTTAYPLHTGWLLADAIYNAGAREVSLLQYYFRMTKASHEAGTIWKKMTPPDLIEGLHWGGKYNARTRLIEYASVYGTPASQVWFKSCVVQRHIARVIQYATRPGFEIARSLETEGCSRTEIPASRRQSSGKKSVRKPIAKR